MVWLCLKEVEMELRFEMRRREVARAQRRNPGNRSEKGATLYSVFYLAWHSHAQYFRLKLEVCIVVSVILQLSIFFRDVHENFYFSLSILVRDSWFQPLISWSHCLQILVRLYINYIHKFSRIPKLLLLSCHLNSWSSFFALFLHCAFSPTPALSILQTAITV